MFTFDFGSIQRSLVSVVAAVLVATTFVSAAVGPAHVTTTAARAA